MIYLKVVLFSLFSFLIRVRGDLKRIKPKEKEPILSHRLMLFRTNMTTPDSKDFLVFLIQ